MKNQLDIKRVITRINCLQHCISDIVEKQRFQNLLYTQPATIQYIKKCRLEFEKHLKQSYSMKVKQEGFMQSDEIMQRSIQKILIIIRMEELNQVYSYFIYHKYDTILKEQNQGFTIIFYLINGELKGPNVSQYEKLGFSFRLNKGQSLWLLEDKCNNNQQNLSECFTVQNNLRRIMEQNRNKALSSKNSAFSKEKKLEIDRFSSYQRESQNKSEEISQIPINFCSLQKP